MIFGEKLQHLRKAKRLSQEQLAAQISISRQAISKWELGVSMPDAENLLQISKLFNVTTDYLLDNELEIETGIEDEIIENAETKNSMAAVESSGLQQVKPKKSTIQIPLIVLAIYMITFAIAMMTELEDFLPFFGIIATAISIVVVIIIQRKWR